MDRVMRTHRTEPGEQRLAVSIQTDHQCTYAESLLWIRVISGCADRTVKHLLLYQPCPAARADNHDLMMCRPSRPGCRSVLTGNSTDRYLSGIDGLTTVDNPGTRLGF